jgi:hypothetical protein
VSEFGVKPTCRDQAAEIPAAHAVLNGDIAIALEESRGRVLAGLDDAGAAMSDGNELNAYWRDGKVAGMNRECSSLW